MQDINIQTDPEKISVGVFNLKEKKKPHNIIIKNNRREPTAKPNLKLTEKQRYRKYKTKTEPNLINKIEVNEDDDILNKIKEALGLKVEKKNTNYSNVETAPLDSIPLPSAFKNEEGELASRRIEFSEDDLGIDELAAHHENIKEIEKGNAISREEFDRRRKFLQNKYNEALQAGKVPNTIQILKEFKAYNFINKTRAERAAEFSDITRDDIGNITMTAQIAPFREYTQEQLFQMVPVVRGEASFMEPRLRNEGDVYFSPEEEDYIMNEADTLEQRIKIANEILKERKEKAPRLMKDAGFLAHLRKVKEAGMTDEERARSARAHKTFEKLTKDASISSDLRVEIPKGRASAPISPTKSELSKMTTVASGDSDNSYAAIFEKHPELKNKFPDLLTYHNYNIKRGERKDPKNIKSYQEAYEYFIKTKRRNTTDSGEIKPTQYKDLFDYYKTKW